MPTIDASTYSKPASLPGFLVKLIGPRRECKPEIRRRLPNGSKGRTVSRGTRRAGDVVALREIAQPWPEMKRRRSLEPLRLSQFGAAQPRQLFDGRTGKPCSRTGDHAPFANGHDPLLRALV